MRWGLLIVTLLAVCALGAPATAQQRRPEPPAAGWAMPPQDFNFNFNTVSFAVGAQVMATDIDECVTGPAARSCEMAFGSILGGAITTTTDARRLTEVTVILPRGAARGRTADPAQELTKTILTLAALLEPRSTERERTNLIQAIFAGGAPTAQPRRTRFRGTDFEISLAPAMALFVVARPAR